MENKKKKDKARGEEVKCVIDNTPPRLPVSCVQKCHQLNQIAYHTKLTDLANAKMLQALFKIHITTGKTFSFRKRPYPKGESNFQSRKREAECIQNDNLKLARDLENIKPKIPTAEQLAKEWKKAQKFRKKYSEVRTTSTSIETTINPPLDIVQYTTEKSLKFPDKRPRVSIEVSIEGCGPIGKMVAVLFSDFVPGTCKNFLSFCDNASSLSYKGCKFYQIIPKFFCMTGDVIHNKGLGGSDIYGRCFDHENYSLKHGETGMLSMDNTQKNKNGSQFLITFRPLHSMDERYVAFGKVILGIKTAKDIESFGTKDGHPLKTLYISDIKQI